MDQKNSIDSVLFDLSHKLKPNRKPQRHIFECHRAKDLCEYLKQIKRFLKNEKKEIQTQKEEIEN